MNVHVIVVVAVEVQQLVPALHAARIAGYRDHELEDDVVGQQVEEVLSVDLPAESGADDMEERSFGTEVRGVVDVLGHFIQVPVGSAGPDGGVAMGEDGEIGRGAP